MACLEVCSSDLMSVERRLFLNHDNSEIIPIYSEEYSYRQSKEDGFLRYDYDIHMTEL